MERVNRTLRRRGIEGLFCTLAYALFDFQERSLRLANSGLPHPFHYRAASGHALPLDVSGLPLGTFDGVSYDELKAELGAGDAVVFYSDGVIEARRGREEYGAERLCRGLEANACRSATEIGERLIADLDASSETRRPTTTSRSSSSKYSKQTTYGNCTERDGDHTAL